MMKRAATGAKGTYSFSESLSKGYLPAPSSIEYEGIFYDYYWETLEENEKSFKTNYSSAISKDPFSGETEYYIGIGLTGKLDGEGLYKHGGRPMLNLVITLDISGSMGSSFGGHEDRTSKIDVAKQSILALLEKLKDNDRFALVLFDTETIVVQKMEYWKSIDQGKLKEEILKITTRGGTDLTKGIQTSTDLYSQIPKDDTNMNRIIFLTDMVPNQGDTDGKSLLNITKKNVKNQLYTTFIGIGIDFNTDLVSYITKLRGSNYFAVKSAKDFKKQMNEEFDYMVTLDVVNAAVDFVSTGGWDVERVFGSPGFEVPEKGRLMFMDSSFPSPKESATMTKGGMIVVKLKRSEKAEKNLKLKVSYEDLKGNKFTDEESATFPEEAKEYYQSISMRKAVLLVRYVSFMKQVLADLEKEAKTPTITSETGIRPPPVTHKSSSSGRTVARKDLTPEFKELVQKMSKYYESEMDVIGDKTLDKHYQQIQNLLEEKK